MPLAADLGEGFGGRESEAQVGQMSEGAILGIDLQDECARISCKLREAISAADYSRRADDEEEVA